MSSETPPPELTEAQRRAKLDAEETAKRLDSLAASTKNADGDGAKKKKKKKNDDAEKEEENANDDRMEEEEEEEEE